MPLGTSSCIFFPLRLHQRREIKTIVLRIAPSAKHPRSLPGLLSQSCQRGVESVINFGGCCPVCVNRSWSHRILEPGRGNPSSYIIQKEWMGSYPCLYKTLIFQKTIFLQGIAGCDIRIPASWVTLQTQRKVPGGTWKGNNLIVLVKTAAVLSGVYFLAFALLLTFLSRYNLH